MQIGLSEKQMRIKQFGLVVGLSFVVFLFMLIYTIQWVIEYDNKLNEFVATDAEIVSHKEIEGINYDVMQFFVDGNEYNITSEYPSESEIGEIVKIYYHKDNVFGIVSRLDNRRTVLPILAISFGCVCVGLFSIYLIIVIGEKRRTKNKN